MSIAEAQAAEKPGQRAPDLLYSETERDLSDSLRSLLAARCRPDDLLARLGGPEPYDTGLWRAIAADMGCAGLLVAEEQDGAGASFREAAITATPFELGCT